MGTQIIKSDYEKMIFTFRAKKVMVDSDLAVLYEVQTKRLKEQVKRNISRFPGDFMFELNDIETLELVANCDRLQSLKHSSVHPMVFTEQRHPQSCSDHKIVFHHDVVPGNCNADIERHAYMAR